MRSTIIPAQITTVEDRIAGNLNLTQILLLMVPVLVTTVLYAHLSPVLRFTYFKLIAIAVVCAVSIGLSIRVKGKVVLQWLAVILRYNLRPRYYLCNKNESYLRVLDLPETKTQILTTTQINSRKAPSNTNNYQSLLGKLQFEELLHTNHISSRFSFKENGHFHVALEQVKS